MTIVSDVLANFFQIAYMRTDHLETLRASIEATLIEESSEGNALACYKRGVGLAEVTIVNIREELAGEPFRDRVHEIRFYKEEAPWIWGYYLYYSQLVEIEVWRKVRSPERLRGLLQKELKRAELYPEKHPVCEYYYRGFTSLDQTYFSRGARAEAMGMFLHPDMPVGTYRLAWMRAYELLREWLADALEGIEYQLMGFEQRRKVALKLEIMEAIELLKGLHARGVFKDWSFKHVVCWAEETFGLKLTHYNSLLQDLCRRKVDRTVFLDKTRKDLLEYMDKRG